MLLNHDLHVIANPPAITTVKFKGEFWTISFLAMNKVLLAIDSR